MAKHKKTRMQKQLADVRRHNASVQAPTFTPKVQTTPDEPAKTTQEIQYSLSSLKPTKSQTVSNSLLYPTYIANDLIRTAVITSGILAAEIILFILSHNHILATPGG